MAHFQMCSMQALQRISAVVDERDQLRTANAIMAYALKAAIADITCGAKWQEYNDPTTTIDVCECALAHGNQTDLLPELEAA